MPKPLQLAPFNVQQLSVYFIVNRLFTKSFNYIMLHLKKQNNNKNCMCWITGKCCCLVLRFCLLVFTVRRFMLIWTHWLPKRSTAPQPRRISVWRDLCLINLKQHVYVELQTLCVCLCLCLISPNSNNLISKLQNKFPYFYFLLFELFVFWLCEIHSCCEKQNT